MAFIRDELWSIVNETKTAPAESNNDGAKYVLRKDRALATIVLAVEPSLFYLLGQDPDNPSEVWKRLAYQFQKKYVAMDNKIIQNYPLFVVIATYKVKVYIFRILTSQVLYILIGTTKDNCSSTSMDMSEY